VAVVALGLWLDLSRGDWCWLVVAIAMVLAAECMNTALESLADAALPEPHPLVGRAKDAAAGAVLCAALGAAGIGLLVLGPPLLHWWGAP
jgi:diacylglycerol kinase